jgi:hypothetical protein
VELISFYENRREMATIIFEILKKVLIKRILRDEVEMNIMEKINWMLKNTEFYVKDLGKWMTDICVKEVVLISGMKRECDIVKSKRFGDSSLPKAISSSFNTFLNLILRIEKVQAGKIDDVDETLKKASVKFFSFKRVEENLLGYLLLFADITYFQKIILAKKVGWNDVKDYVSGMKEKTFPLIIESSGTRRIDFSILEIVKLKTVVKETITRFNEFIDSIPPQNMKVSLITYFYESLNDHFIGFIFSQDCIPADESFILSETADYIVSWSKGITELSSRDKVETIRDVLVLNLKEIEKEYDDGKIHLEEDEIIGLIYALFESSDARSTLVAKLRKIRKCD